MPASSPSAAKECLAIIGVGLIGGSIGLAARRSGRYAPILGVEPDAANLAKARTTGCIDEGTTDMNAASRRADIVVVCAPVIQIAKLVVEAAQVLRNGAVITDAGSTKAMIVEEVEGSVPSQHQFVGSHPLAGSEKQGPDNARADLFDNRLTVMTPTERTPAPLVDRVGRFWEDLGCGVRTMSPARHDRAMSLTSHLPHLLSAMLAGMLPSELVELAASGFRDMTRLAAGDPTLWASIFLQNRSNMIDAVDAVQKRLPEFKNALIENDGRKIEQLLSDAKRIRDDLGD